MARLHPVVLRMLRIESIMTNIAIQSPKPIMKMRQQSIIGNSDPLQKALDKASRLATINRPVLIIGERGSGKELIAERLHYLSSRWQQQLIKVNCASLSESLLESELFGHEVGSFTGATKLRRGRFELAAGGTLFLDEIANTSNRLQEALLRVIEYQEFERIGGQTTLTSDARIIAATNEDLQALSRAHKFRADLLDRLAFEVITIPPLRERGDDCLILADYFALNMTKELGWQEFNGFTQRARQDLLNYSWPGNVRELKNVVERSLFAAESPSKPIDKILLNPFESAYRLQTPIEESQHDLITLYERSGNLKDFIQESEQQIIEYALQQNNFHQAHAAQFLGISYHSMRAYLKKYRMTEKQTND